MKKVKTTPLKGKTTLRKGKTIPNETERKLAEGETNMREVKTNMRKGETKPLKGETGKGLAGGGSVVQFTIKLPHGSMQGQQQLKNRIRCTTGG